MVKTDYKANWLKVVDITAQRTKPTQLQQPGDIFFVFGSLFIEAHDNGESFERSKDIWF